MTGVQTCALPILAALIELRKENKSNVVIAGSVNEITLQQTEIAASTLSINTIDIEAEAIIAGKKDTEKKRILKLAEKSISRGKDLIIRSASTPESVSRCMIKGRKLGLDDFMISDIIADFLETWQVK